MPGTKGDPKSSETIGIEKKIIAENVNVNVSVNVNRTIEIFKNLWNLVKSLSLSTTSLPSTSANFSGASLSTVKNVSITLDIFSNRSLYLHH